MYEKILVPLDGSELAEVALPYAEGLTRGLGSEITLIHVRAPAEDPYHPMHQAYMQKMVETAKNDIEQDLGKEIKVRSAIVGSSVLVGHPAEEIVDYADKEDISLIVMATHGRSGIRRWALGSVADKVVRATRRPVMLIRAKGARSDVRGQDVLKKALVTLDGSRESEAVVPYVEELASGLKIEVTLLRVVPRAYRLEGQVPYTDDEMKPLTANAEGYLGDVASGFRYKNITAMPLVVIGSVAEKILEIADETTADVVVMSTHGESGMSRWEHGSIANKVLHAGNTPLLLVRPR